MAGPLRKLRRVCPFKLPRCCRFGACQRLSDAIANRARHFFTARGRDWGEERTGWDARRAQFLGGGGRVVAADGGFEAIRGRFDAVAQRAGTEPGFSWSPAPCGLERLSRTDWAMRSACWASAALITSSARRRSRRVRSSVRPVIDRGIREFWICSRKSARCLGLGSEAPPSPCPLPPAGEGSFEGEGAFVWACLTRPGAGLRRGALLRV